MYSNIKIKKKKTRKTKIKTQSLMKIYRKIRKILLMILIWKAINKKKAKAMKKIYTIQPSLALNFNDEGGHYLLFII